MVLIWLLLVPFFAAGCAELFPRLALRVRSEAEKQALGWAPFSLGVLASAMALVSAASLIPSALGGTPLTADYWWTSDLYHLRFQADALTMPAVLIVHAVGFLAHLHLVGVRATGQSHHRAALVLVAQGCGAAAVVSADVIALIFFLDCMLVSLWLFAALDRPQQGGRLLATVHSASLLVLAAGLIMWERAGESSLSALPLLLLSEGPSAVGVLAVLILLGLLPRIAAFPGHGWLPGLLPSRPGVAMIPGALLLVAGGTVLLRLLPGSLMLPTIPVSSALGLALGTATLLWGTLRASLAMDLSGVAAWLTVAQSGHLLLALGAAGSLPPSPPALQAACLHLLVAPLAVLALWSASAAVRHRVGTDSLAGLSGLVRTMPLAGAALLAGGLSLAGVPPLAGFQIQRLLIPGLWHAGHPVLAVVALAADLFLAFIVVNAFRRCFLRREPAPVPSPPSLWLSTQLAVLVLALLAVGIYSRPTLGWSEHVVRSELSVSL